MSSRASAALHITNGDAVIYLFKKAGILGTHLPWRDVLHEGPVPGDLTLEECSRVRGAYLASRGHGKPIKVMHDFQMRDATIRKAKEFSEVVLWFEHDLYDQLQLLQILAVLDDMKLDPGIVSIVHSDSYLGSMTADEIVELHPKRRTVTAAIFARARAVWSAFTSADPLELQQMAGQDHPGFPHLRAGLRRLCEEYPWTSDGMSRSHRHALHAVAQGPTKDEELFRRAQAREEAPFLGDTTFYAILNDLRADGGALIEGEPGFLTLTELGRRIVAGDGDWLDSVELDRWIGGVHLQGKSATRYDEVTQSFQPAK